MTRLMMALWQGPKPPGSQPGKVVGATHRKEVRAMTYREYATMDRLMQGITPAPVEYIAEELGGEKFKTVCDDIYAVLKENELSVEQAEVMLEVVKARLKKIAKI